MNIKPLKFSRQVFLSFILVYTLYACSSDNNAPAKTSQTTTEMPTDLQKLILPGGATLSAFVTIDGDTANRIAMTINAAGTGSASVTIPKLSRAVHTVTITYEYTDGVGTIVLADTSNTVDLSAGSGNINFSAADYDLESFDTDGDGISNAAELKDGTDPRDSVCQLDTSLLDSCTLG